MDSYTINDFSEDLGKNDRELFKLLYKKYFSAIKKMVLLNNGNDDDAKDVFQEGIIIVIRNVENNKIDKNVKFQTYLFSVCKYIWLKNLRDNKNKFVSENENNYYISNLKEDTQDLTDIIDDSVRKGIFQRNFLKLDEICQKILKLFFEKLQIKEITKIMGFKSDNYAKKKKFLCKEKLIRFIKNDKWYQRIMKEKNYL